jgi:chromosome partitioning protein
VGKTTAAINLTYRIAEGDSKKGKKKRILVVDFDPQLNFTKFWLPDINNMRLNPNASSSVLFKDGAKIEPMSVAPIQVGAKALYEGQIDILYADKESLSEVELEPESAFSSALIQEQALDQLGYDYVIYDCPPALCIKQIVAVCTCDDVITPMELDGFSAEGILNIYEMIEKAKALSQQSGRHDRPGWHIFANKVFVSSSASSQMLSDVREQLGDTLLKNFISSSSVISDAVMNRRPIFKLPPNGNAAAVGRKYKLVLDELLERIGE